MTCASTRLVSRVVPGKMNADFNPTCPMTRDPHFGGIMRIATLLAAAALLLSIPVQAKPAFLAKAKELGIAEVKDCKACHAGTPKKGGDMTERGKFLIKTKADKKATEVDVAWLKGYKGK
jgi:hypothetical protein